MNEKNKWLLNCSPIITAILFSTSFVPYYPWALFYAFVPLWLTWLRDPTPRVVFVRGWIMQIIAVSIGFAWIIYTTRQFGHLSLPISILTLFLFSAISGLQYPLAGLTWAICYKKINFTKLQSLLLLASLTFIYESFLPTIFPWNLGVPWIYANFPAAQWADVIGVTGLNFITFILNAVMAFIWLERHNRILCIKILILTILIFIALQISGFWHGLNYKYNYTNKIPLKVLIIQGNIDNNIKLAAEKSLAKQARILDTYFQLTTSALDRFHATNLVIWPEVAFAGAINHSNSSTINMHNLFKFIRKTNKNFLIGAYSENHFPQARYNAAFLINNKGKIIGIYKKTILLSFGEYTPGATIFPILKKITPGIPQLDAGSRVNILSLNGYRIGVQICYESLFPSLSRAMILQGANMFINITNDAWFGGGAQAQQHLYSMLGRAIEFRTPIIRATNTGISTTIDAYGSHSILSPWGKPWYTQFTILLDPKPTLTFYAKYGFILPYIILLIVIIYIVKKIYNDTIIGPY